VSDRTQSGRSVPLRPLTGPNGFVVSIACIVSVLAILIGGHLYGHFLASRDLGGRDNTIEQLSAQSQNLKIHADNLSAQLTDLQVQLAKTQAALDAIMPSTNTYDINSNQSLIVGDGHLTIGLIGSPGNDSVTLDINGKQQAASAGQVIPVAVGSSINCQVQVQSFDLFKATLVASCAGAKPQ
jgi:hypothetical protein